MRFNSHGCFLEDMKNDCFLVAKGNRDGKMFTLDARIPKICATMFAHGKVVVANIDIWYKRIGHINIGG